MPDVESEDSKKRKEDWEARKAARLERRRQARKGRFWRAVYLALRRRVLLGLVTIVPILVAIWVSIFIINQIYEFSKPALEGLTGIDDLDQPQNFYLYVSFRVLAVFLFISGLYIIGLMSSTFFVRRVIRLGEAIVEQIPGIKSIYRGSKQLVETISIQTMASFSEVVLIQYTRKGVWIVGFVTGETEIRNTGVEFVNLFVPTTPNPTSGFLVMMDPKEILCTNLTIEEGVKLVMSAGIVSPADLKTITYAERHKLKKHERPREVTGSGESDTS